MARAIAVTFDYRCPFAYNGNAAVVAALRAGSDIEFRFTPFSLDQAHIEEGETPVWDRGRLPAGMRLDGPAIVLESACTTLVPPGWRADVTPAGHLLMRRGGSDGG